MYGLKDLAPKTVSFGSSMLKRRTINLDSDDGLFLIGVDRLVCTTSVRTQGFCYKLMSIAYSYQQTMHLPIAYQQFTIHT